MSEIISYDPDHSILISTYFQDYCDLDDFYTQNQSFIPAIAASLGHILATLHLTTLDYHPIQRELYPQQNPTVNPSDDKELDWVPDFCEGLEYLTPDAFGSLSDDGLKFFELCHRSEPLMEAIAQLGQHYEPCCLTHQDLKFNNVLLHLDWHQRMTHPQQQDHASLLRIIDWEKAEWGDPAFDLGSLVAGYLRLWLNSLVISGLDIKASLRLARVPLEQLRPSLVALVRAYASHCPAVVERDPDFWLRVMQFAGYSLIRTLRVKILQHEALGNTGLCTFHVATSLLCHPEAAIAAVFGVPQSALTATLTATDSFTLEGIPKVDSIDHTIMPTPPVSPRPVLPTALAELIPQLEIQPDGSVWYGQNSLSTSSELPSIGHLPDPLQQTYFRLQMRNVLYDVLFSGERAAANAIGEPLANSTHRGVDVEFFEQLTMANGGQGYVEDSWEVVQKPLQGGLLLQRQGLKLLVEQESDLISQHTLTHKIESLEPGSSVAVQMPPYRMDDGFYIAIGDHGPLDATQPTVQIFFNLMPEGAIALMRYFTQALNAAQIAYSFSVLYDPIDYGRRDAAILRILADDFLAVRPLLQRGFERVRSQLQPTVPLFTKRLAPGIGLAEEPIDSAIDFGLHRCQILANVLLAAPPDQRLALLHQQFEQAGLTLEYPYLNPNRGDRYDPLEEVQG